MSHERHPDDVHDSERLTVIEANRDGLPCFGCYFGALFATFTPKQLASIPVEDEDAPPEQVEYARRFVAAMAYIADCIAALAVDAAGEHAGDVHLAFLSRLRNMIDLHQVPVEGLVN